MGKDPMQQFKITHVFPSVHFWCIFREKMPDYFQIRAGSPTGGQVNPCLEKFIRFLRPQASQRLENSNQSFVNKEIVHYHLRSSFVAKIYKKIHIWFWLPFLWEKRKIFQIKRKKNFIIVEIQKKESRIWKLVKYLKQHNTSYISFVNFQKCQTS